MSASPSSTLAVGVNVDALDISDVWCPGSVTAVKADAHAGNLFQVHFWGWPCTYDEWLPESRLRPAGTQVECALVWAKSALGGLKQLVWWPCKLFLRRPETEDGVQGLHAEKNALVSPYGLRIPPWKNLLHYGEGNKSPSASYKAPQLMWVSRENIAPFSGPKSAALADETLQAAGNGFSGRFGSTVTMQALDAAIQLARDDMQASDREVLFIGHGTVPAAYKARESAVKRPAHVSPTTSAHSLVPSTARIVDELPSAADPAPVLAAAPTVIKQATGVKRKRPETAAAPAPPRTSVVTVVRYGPDGEPAPRTDMPEKYIDDLAHLQRCIDRRRLLEFGDSVVVPSTSAWDQSNFTHLVGGGRYWTTGQH